MDNYQRIQGASVPTNMKDIFKALKWAFIISIISSALNWFVMWVSYTIWYGNSYISNQFIEYISIILNGPLYLVLLLAKTLGFNDLAWILGWTGMISAPIISFLFWTIVIFIFLRFKRNNYPLNDSKVKAESFSLVSYISNLRPNKKLLLAFFILLVVGFFSVYIGKGQYVSNLLLMIKGGCTSNIDFLFTRNCYGAVDRYIIQIGYLLYRIAIIPLVLAFFFKRGNSLVNKDFLLK